jgi:hypothetical protein
MRVAGACPALEAGQPRPPDWEAQEKEAAEALRRLCSQLPHYHLKTLGFLCHHLNRISLQAELNNMPASNLAIGTCNFFFPYLTRNRQLVTGLYRKPGAVQIQKGVKLQCCCSLCRLPLFYPYWGEVGIETAVHMQTAAAISEELYSILYLHNTTGYGP